MTNHLISEKWIKASIVGTIWAASEIVLGSFLHNLRIPFSGNLLTAIGLLILISFGYIWTEKGLFWRAGLICAIMKTMSPSAIIFGPMIAIFSEALLLEISVRLLGRTFAGFALGGMLAMSWNLFQKIVNYIIFYGFNIVEVYSNLLKYAQKQLSIQFDIVWLPIFVLLIAFCLFGLAAAIIGITTGRRILKQPRGYNTVDFTGSGNLKSKQVTPEFRYSIPWLIVDILLIIGALILLNITTWIYWSLSIVCILILWAFRYKRAMRQLAKPGFWIFFAIITMITAFIFVKSQSGDDGLTEGLLIGFQMNFRAAVIIVGFSVLGTELYNPKVRGFFLRTSFKQLPLALELSFESLPVTIANIPEFKTLVRNPLLVVSQFVSMAESRLAEMKDKKGFAQKVFILTGAVGQGKTTQIRNIINVLKEKKINVGGIYSPRLMENGITTGYDIVDISKNVRERFLKLAGNDDVNRVGKYSIISGGLQSGLNALDAANIKRNQVVVIDEVGILELDGQGWAHKIDDLLKASINHLLIVVRENLVGEVIKKWDLKPGFVFNISEYEYISTSEIILNEIM